MLLLNVCPRAGTVGKFLLTLTTYVTRFNPLQLLIIVNRELKFIDLLFYLFRYKMISHKRETGNEPNPQRFDMARFTNRNWKKDGLNSLEYKVINSIHKIH